MVEKRRGWWRWWMKCLVGTCNRGVKEEGRRWKISGTERKTERERVKEREMMMEVEGG